MDHPWGLLIDNCLKKFPSFKDRHWLDKSEVCSSSVILLLGMFVYSYIIFCFIYRKLTRGSFCQNHAQALFFIISLCLVTYTASRTALNVFRVTGLQGYKTQTLAFWTLSDFCEWLDETCPYFCTLLLALYRFCIICNPSRDMKYAKSPRLWLYFVAYCITSAGFIAAKKVLGCNPFRINLFKAVAIQYWSGLFWYILVDVVLPVVFLTVITIFHYKATKELRSAYLWERKSLLNNANQHLLESAYFLPRHSAGLRVRTEENCLKEERHYLFIIQFYVSIVTPALLLRLIVKSLFIWDDLLLIYRLSIGWIVILKYILYDLLTVLFVLEFVFFIHTNYEFRLCLIYPMRDLRGVFKNKLNEQNGSVNMRHARKRDCATRLIDLEDARSYFDRMEHN